MTSHRLPSTLDLAKRDTPAMLYYTHTIYLGDIAAAEVEILVKPCLTWNSNDVVLDLSVFDLGGHEHQIEDDDLSYKIKAAHFGELFDLAIDRDREYAWDVTS